MNDENMSNDEFDRHGDLKNEETGYSSDSGDSDEPLLQKFERYKKKRLRLKKVCLDCMRVHSTPPRQSHGITSIVHFDHSIQMLISESSIAIGSCWELKC